MFVHVLFLRKTVTWQGQHSLRRRVISDFQHQDLQLCRQLPSRQAPVKTCFCLSKVKSLQRPIAYIFPSSHMNNFYFWCTLHSNKNLTYSSYPWACFKCESPDKRGRWHFLQRSPPSCASCHSFVSYSFSLSWKDGVPRERIKFPTDNL